MTRSWFDRWFFIPVDARRLGVQRIVTVLLAFWLDYIWGVPYNIQDVPRRFVQPVTLARPFFLAGMPPERLLVAAKWILVAALLLVLVGYRTRVASAVVALVGLPYLGVASSFGKVTCIACPLYLALLVGAFAPWGDALSIDAWRARTPPRASPEVGAYVRLYHALLGLFYLSSAIQKLRHAPGAWLSGTQLEGYLLWLPFGTEWTGSALFILRHPVVCQILGIASVAFEGTFFLSFFFRRLLWPMILGSILFHVGIWLAMRIEYTSVWPLLAACVPSERLFDWLARWRRRGPRAQTPAVSAGAGS